MNDFTNAIEFILRHTGRCCGSKIGRAPRSSASPRVARGDPHRRPARRSGSATSTAGRSSRINICEHRPRAAEPRDHRDHEHRAARPRLPQRDGRARHARRPADHLTNAYVGGRRGRPRRGRGRARHGHDAARGLLRVELPLALPLIFAGIRTAAVYVIATATLAADRRRRRARRHHRQPGQLRRRGRRRRRDLRRGLALAAELVFAGAATRRDPEGAARHGDKHRATPDRSQAAIMNVSIIERQGALLAEIRLAARRRSAACCSTTASRHAATTTRGEQRRRRRPPRSPARASRAVTLGDEELHRAVHPRRALHAGAEGEGLHGQAEAATSASRRSPTRRSRAARSTSTPSTPARSLTVDREARRQTPDERRGDLRAGQGVRGEARLHAARRDAVLRLPTAWP